MVLDHVGVAVRSIEDALSRWERVFGYRRMTGVVTNTRQKVKVTFLEKPGCLAIKLIEPSDAASPLQNFVKQRGGGLHHLCFRCESVDSELVRLEALGLRVLAAEPGEAFENERIAFVYAGDGLNVELIDTERRAARLG
jgi:methylmalonyl-CoA/ethylmalonyl-CoA epimerase